MTRASRTRLLLLVLAMLSLAWAGLCDSAPTPRAPKATRPTVRSAANKARTSIVKKKPPATRKGGAVHRSRRRGHRRPAPPVIVVDKTLPARMADARLKVTTIKTPKAAADSTRLWINRQPHDSRYALFVLPGQELSIRAHIANGLAQRWEGVGSFGPPAPAIAPAPRVRMGKNARKPPISTDPTGRLFSWRAPQEPGPTNLVLKGATKSGWKEVARLPVQVMLPADHLVAGRLNGYLIGNYPQPHDMGDSTYMPPIAFLKAGLGGGGTRISPNFFLEDFACHEATSGDERYMALSPRLIPFLEALSSRARQAADGGPIDGSVGAAQPVAARIADAPATTKNASGAPPAAQAPRSKRDRATKPSPPAPTFTGALAAAASNLAGAAAAIAAPSMPAPAGRALDDSTITGLAFAAPSNSGDPRKPVAAGEGADSDVPASPNLSTAVLEALAPAAAPAARAENPSPAKARSTRRAGGEGGATTPPYTADMASVVAQRPIKILSGYRTPAYNRQLNTARLSRHQYGDASDIYIDMNNDGVMDDLNHDGAVDGRDAMTLAAWIEDLWARPEFRGCQGGLGIYNGTGAHGPFVHVDMRGFKARWGGNGLRWDDESITARDLLVRYRSALPPPVVDDTDPGDGEPGDTPDR